MDCQALAQAVPMHLRGLVTCFLFYLFYFLFSVDYLNHPDSLQIRKSSMVLNYSFSSTHNSSDGKVEGTNLIAGGYRKQLLLLYHAYTKSCVGVEQVKLVHTMQVANSLCDKNNSKVSL